MILMTPWVHFVPQVQLDVDEVKSGKVSFSELWHLYHITDS